MNLLLHGDAHAADTGVESVFETYIAQRTVDNTEKWREASEHFLSQVETLAGNESESYYNALRMVGNDRFEAGQSDAALKIWFRMSVLAENLYEVGHPEIGSMFERVAVTLQDLDRYEEALPYFLKAKQATSDQDKQYTQVYERRLKGAFSCLLRLQKIKEALPMQREILSRVEARLGKDHPSYGPELNNLAYCLNALGRRAEAIPLFRAAWEHGRIHLGDEHVETILRLSNLLTCLMAENRLGEALPLFRKAVNLTGNRLGTDHPDYEVMLTRLGVCLFKLKRYEEALVPLQRALLSFRMIHGTEHHAYLRKLQNVINCLNALDRYEEALAFHREAQELLEILVGKAHPDYGRKLDHLGRCLDKLGRHEEALHYFQRALHHALEYEGKQHPTYARRLNNIGICLERLARYDEALMMLRQSVELTESLLSKDHPTYWLRLINMAHCLDKMGRSKEALPLMEQALQFTEKHEGIDSERYGDTLKYYASCLGNLGRYKEALSAYERSLDSAQRYKGENSPSYLRRANGKAVILMHLGHYKEALSVLENVILISQDFYGARHRAPAMYQSNLANAFKFLGRYDDAVEASRMASQSVLLNLGELHPDFLWSLNTYADSIMYAGRYDEAVSEFQQLLSRIEDVGMTDTQLHGVVLSNLANSLGKMGRHEEALPLLQYSVDLSEKLWGLDHPVHIGRLNNLAACISRVSGPERALPIQRQVLEHAEQIMGKQHPEFSKFLSNLSHLLREVGRVDEALRLSQQAFELNKSHYGEKHPYSIPSLHGLMFSYLLLDRNEEALATAMAALDIAATTVGRSHDLYSDALNKVAYCLDALEQYDKSLPLHHEALVAVQKQLTQNAIFRSESEQLAAAERVGFYLEHLLQHPRLSPKDGFQAILNWKGSILKRQRAARLAMRDGQLTHLFTLLKENASHLAAIAGNPPEDPMRLDDWEVQLKNLTQRQTKLERELNQVSPVYREAAKPLDVRKLQSSLPTKSALVDYYVSGEGEEAQLIAHLIFPERQVLRFNLGKTARLETLVTEWRKSLTGLGDDKPAGRALRELIWKPFADQLIARDLILISPDDLIASIPFAALPDIHGDSRLLEQFRVSMIPVPQLLPALLERISPPEAPKGLLVIGDVDYRQTNTAELAHSSPTHIHHTQLLPSSFRGGMNFPALIETRREIKRIEQIYRRVFVPEDREVTSLTGLDASETAFIRALGRSSHIHIATHGFFAPPEISSAFLANQRPILKESDSETNSTRSIVLGYDPNLLSGLAFAGANQPPATDKSVDGILTAREVAFLVMDHVELVTLSACETGLGEVAGGEGLLGLQRAFQVAGVSSTLASLWKVDDRLTQILMERFYENHWEKGLTKLDALREAQLALMRNPQLLHAGQDITENTQSLRGFKLIDMGKNRVSNRIHPFYWAGFLISGYWQ